MTEISEKTKVRLEMGAVIAALVVWVLWVTDSIYTIKSDVAVIRHALSIDNPTTAHK